LYSHSIFSAFKTFVSHKVTLFWRSIDSEGLSLELGIHSLSVRLHFSETHDLSGAVSAALTLRTEHPGTSQSKVLADGRKVNQNKLFHSILIFSAAQFINGEMQSMAGVARIIPRSCHF
jgi:hypothetical protein